MTESGRSLPEGWLCSLIEGNPSPLIVTDQEGKVALVSQGAERLFGYSRHELVGREIELFIRQREGLELGELGRSGQRKDGSAVALEIGLSALETPGGPLTLASIVDVTARRESEDELRRSNADLQQFAYIASHDLQEPLRMVASYTELLALRYQGKLDERADKYIHYAVDGAKRMQRLLTDLLAYSRVVSQGRPLVPVSSAAVMKGVLGTLAPATRRANARVEVGALPTVRADERQLAQLLLALLDNALKFQSDTPPIVAVEASLVHDGWQFAVRDNGIGIEIQHRDRIFQMFQRLHERGQYEGSGAGLALAKRIVERHGGRIWVDSEPRVGSTFFFTLPAATLPGEP